MPCPLCGDACRCAPESQPAQIRSMMRSRFEPDVEAEASARPVAVVAEHGSSEASPNLEKRPEAGPRARFVVEREDEWNGNTVAEAGAASCETTGGRRESDAETTEHDDGQSTPVQAELLQEQEVSWKQEVAARVNHYRARRRPRGPRYPSLQLRFEASEPGWASHATGETPLPARATRQALAVERAQTEPARAEVGVAAAIVDAGLAAPETAKIIEFPRTANAPPQSLEELAEPMLDRPRILEVPEVAPLPPALGGILIEPAEQAAQEKRPGFEIPLQSAPMVRRVLAGAIDGVLVLAAFAGFAYIFFRVTEVVPSLQQAGAASAFLAGLFWAAYQYLMMVHAGTTPGLMAARLRVSRFDGSRAAQSLRRWRVLASVLSGVSLGLGYAWCFLDEDGLCWHDRITRTYLAPSARQ